MEVDDCIMNKNENSLALSPKVKNTIQLRAFSLSSSDWCLTLNVFLSSVLFNTERTITVTEIEKLKKKKKDNTTRVKWFLYTTTTHWKKKT